MASSRIFVKGLPPTFTEAEFRKHFSQSREVTDAKIFSNRRIGYVGYKTPEEAQKAVKYFNKSFIRMSRIGVELARPPAEIQPHAGHVAPTARKEAEGVAVEHRQPQDGGEKAATIEADPKLKEFMEVMRPKNKKRAWEEKLSTDAGDAVVMAPAIDGQTQSDDEYEDVPKPQKRLKKDVVAVEEPTQLDKASPALEEDAEALVTEEVAEPNNAAVSDADWARSRTSRLLGLQDDEEEEDVNAAPTRAQQQPDSDNDTESFPADMKPLKKDPSTSMPTPPSDHDDGNDVPDVDNEEASPVRAGMRLFLRNLSYDVTNEDLYAEFGQFGHVEEVHIPLDKKSGTPKGFAYIQYSDPDAAETALQHKDGQYFQGRLLHILPASKKRESQLDEFELAKLPLKKQQQIKRRREASTSTFNWNALYMNPDAVMSSVASKLGLSKSEVLDPTSSDAAIIQAHAETHVIQQTKDYFAKHGVDLDAFKRSQRGDTGILIKNIPFDCSQDELRRLFEEHGEIKRFLMPPSQTLAIVEFANAAQCKAAFGSLAYRKLKSSVLFLEKAPKGLFDGKVTKTDEQTGDDGVSKTSAVDLKDNTQGVVNTAGMATVFVRNLNFSTTTQLLTETFQPLDGFMSARVKTKTDPKKPGQILSMGFGFLEFRSAQQAQSAIKTMDGHTLEGHKLQLRASHKGADAAESRRAADAQKRAAGRRTKVIIKNLPFEASKKDVRALFGAYGQLRSVRVPKKMDRAARGFAFADFTTPKEAESAMEALKDTHLLGRRLVLDFAEEEPEDAEAEIAKMQEKVGKQVNKVALQKVMGSGRKKFTTQAEEE